MPAPFNPTPPDVRYETQYIDDYGQLIATFIYEETTIQNGTRVIELKRNAYIQTADGLQFNITLGKGDKPIRLAVCNACRKPRLFGPTPHGLVVRDEAKVCACGELCCPRHRRKKHGCWRCLPCHKKYKRRLFRRWLLFTRG